MTAFIRLFLTVFLLTACDAEVTADGLRSAAPSPAPPPAAKDWCDVYTCAPCPSTGCPPDGVRVSYCCPISGSCGSGDEVPAGTVCPEGEFLVICNWGQSNVDGTFTCYEG